MSSRLTRRQYLLGTGGVIAAGSFTMRARAADECQAVDRLAETLAERRAVEDRVAADLDAARSTRTALETRLVALQGGTDAGSSFTPSVRDAALENGLAARASIAYLSIDYGTATGWFVDDGLLLTNSHNVAEMNDAHGWTLDGERFEFEVVNRVSDQDPDVALLRTDHDAPSLPTGTTASLAPGDPLVQVGHPGGFGNWVITLGAVRDSSGTSITSTVPGQSGSSGSPVLSLDGAVVGMTYAGSPIDERAFGATPTPAPDDVHYEPLAAREDSLHVPVEAAMDRLEAWT